MNMNQDEGLAVLVIGGVGQMGRHVVRKLDELPGVGRIVVADLDGRRASLLAEEIGPGARALELDATNRVALDAAMADVDVVVNMLGPYDIFGIPILTASIENRKDYVDVCDDWGATVNALELDSLAKEHGVRALVGFGMSPGVTNFLALAAAEELDRVDRLVTGWSLAATGVEFEEEYDAGRSASAALQHWILQSAAPIEIWREGRFTQVDPLEAVEARWPGQEVATTFTLGHPEPISLPRNVEVTDEVLNVMTGPGWIFDQLKDVVERHKAGEFDLEGATAAIYPLERPAGVPSSHETFPWVWAQAEGELDGVPATVSVSLDSKFPHQMGGNTGHPAALAVQLLAEGKVTGTGVLAPEQTTDVAQAARLFAPHTEPPSTAESIFRVEVEKEG